LFETLLKVTNIFVSAARKKTTPTAIKGTKRNDCFLTCPHIFRWNHAEIVKLSNLKNRWIKKYSKFSLNFNDIFMNYIERTQMIKF
jgi:hypothetical protein